MSMEELKRYFTYAKAVQVQPIQETKAENIR